MSIRYVALLRGVNVGGNNKIAMPELKFEFERRGFKNVRTYINSGNIIFDNDLDEAAVKIACEDLIKAGFNLRIIVCVIAADEICDALAHAPEWWGSDPQSKHNALFVVPPASAEEVCAQVGEVKPEYEKVDHFGKVIFWSAPIATFSRTRWSKIVQNKAAYNAVTIRNANTTKKLAILAQDGRGL